MKTLLLWDIDGTLITAHGSGEAALREAGADAVSSNLPDREAFWQLVLS